MDTYIFINKWKWIAGCDGWGVKYVFHYYFDGNLLCQAYAFHLNADFLICLPFNKVVLIQSCCQQLVADIKGLSVIVTIHVHIFKNSIFSFYSDIPDLDHSLQSCNRCWQKPLLWGFWSLSVRYDHMDTVWTHLHLYTLMMSLVINAALSWMMSLVINAAALSSGALFSSIT